MPKSSQAAKQPDIVLLHGLRGAPVGLQDIKKSLEQRGYVVHTPAVPPFANANFVDHETNAYHPQDYADYFASWIKASNLVHPVLIGHSMGSLVAAALARYHPELIDKRIFLLSPISTRAKLPFRAASPLASLLPSNLVDYATTRFLFVGHDRQKFQQVMEATHACSSHNYDTTTKQLQRVFKFSVAYGIDDVLNDIDDLSHMSIYIIAGAKDRLISRESTEKLATKLSAETHFIENTGHLHNYEKPTETAELIANILKDS